MFYVTSTSTQTVVSGRPVIPWSDPRLSHMDIPGPSASQSKESRSAFRGCALDLEAGFNDYLGGTWRVTAGVPRQVRAHGGGDWGVRRPAAGRDRVAAEGTEGRG